MSKVVSGFIDGLAMNLTVLSADEHDQCLRLRSTRIYYIVVTFSMYFALHKRIRIEYESCVHIIAQQVMTLENRDKLQSASKVFAAQAALL